SSRAGILPGQQWAYAGTTKMLSRARFKASGRPRFSAPTRFLHHFPRTTMRILKDEVRCLRRFDSSDADPRKQREHAGERDDCRGLVAECRLHPSAVRDQECQGEDREEKGANDSVELLHFAEAREQTDHR